MLFKNIFLLLIMSLHGNLFAAQSLPLKLKVAVVDYNKNQSIEAFISNEPSVINIYGAMPCYSAFLLYKEFDLGFDSKDIQYNFNALLATAMKIKLKECKERYIVHFLLPSYFADLDKETDIRVIYASLSQAAIFYKKIYRNFFAEDDLKVCIVIPPLSYFSSTIVTKMRNVFEINMDIVKNLIRKLGLKHKYVIINQNFDEVKSIIEYLKQAGFYEIVGLTLPLLM